MANTKISALPASTTPLAGTEVLPIVQSTTTKQVSVANLTAGRAVATGALTVTGAATVSSTLGVAGATTLFSVATTSGTVANTPSGSTDIANKAYVDTVAQGLDTKASVVAGTTANITLSGTQTVDGVVLIAGDRVLVKNQTAPADNGLYLCAAGSWTRTTDMDTWAEVPGAYVFVEQGTTLADTGWVCTSDAGGTIGVTAIVWAQFSGAGSGVSSISFGSTGLTPSSVTTGAVVVSGTLAVANGGTGITSFGTGIATFLGTPSSANLAAALTDETGTGVAVFATNPVLVTPNLGTPSAAVLTSATGLPLTTGVTGLLPVANGGTGTATPALVQGSNVTITGTWPNQTIAASGNSGTVTSVAATVPSLFSITGSPITTSGTLAMTYSGTALPVVNGGTGQTSYTDGQLLIGNTTGNTLAKTTLTAGSGITITNGSGAITIASSGGSGDVVGPASSTDNAIARFDSTTGKLLQNSTATLGDSGEAVFATGTFGASSGGVTTVTAIGNTLSNIVIGDPSTASSSSGIQFKGGSSTTNWVISGNGNVTSGIEITPSTTVNGTTFNAPVVKVTSTGLIAKTTIAVGNATPSTSGSGITFPASVSDSTDAQTLDDYEEGTWTPTQGSGLTLVGAFSSSGRYVKIGKTVMLIGSVAGATTVALSSNGELCGGLPFTAAVEPYPLALLNCANTKSGAGLSTGTNITECSAMTASANIKFTITYFV